MDNLGKRLLEHFGHEIEIAVYGDIDHPVDVSLECLTCGCVIFDSDIYDLVADDDAMTDFFNAVNADPAKSD